MRKILALAILNLLLLGGTAEAFVTAGSKGQLQTLPQWVNMGPDWLTPPRFRTATFGPNGETLIEMESLQANHLYYYPVPQGVRPVYSPHNPGARPMGPSTYHPGNVGTPQFNTPVTVPRSNHHQGVVQPGTVMVGPGGHMIQAPSVIVSPGGNMMIHTPGPVIYPNGRVQYPIPRSRMGLGNQVFVQTGPYGDTTLRVPGAMINSRNTSVIRTPGAVIGPNTGIFIQQPATFHHMPNYQKQFGW